MNSRVKSAFRIFSASDDALFLQYTNSPVNRSHPNAADVKILGNKNPLKCQPGEFCPKKNFKLVESDVFPPQITFINADFSNNFPKHRVSEIIKFCKKSIEERKIIIHATQHEIKKQQLIKSEELCRQLTTSEELFDNYSYNCIGYAFGLKETIDPRVFNFNQDLSPESNVKKFFEEIIKHYNSKDSNVLGLLSILPNTHIKCYTSFSEFYKTNTLPHNNDIALYFSDHFLELLHGARYSTYLTEDIPLLNAFVSKLGEDFLVSHSTLDVFYAKHIDEDGDPDLSFDIYGSHLCYISMVTVSNHDSEL